MKNTTPTPQQFQPLDREKAAEALVAMGFQKNREPLRGYRPHFRKGNEIVFLIGANYWRSRIVLIEAAFSRSPYTIYGVLITDYLKEPKPDWMFKNLLLDPISQMVCWSADWGRTSQVAEYGKANPTFSKSL